MQFGLEKKKEHTVSLSNLQFMFFNDTAEFCQVLVLHLGGSLTGVQRGTGSGMND